MLLRLFVIAKRVGKNRQRQLRRAAAAVAELESGVMCICT